MASKSKAALWMCCVCLRASRHPDSVQCERCLACAHCTCAGFRTYAEAQSSSQLFFCARCSDAIHGKPPSSPIAKAPQPSSPNSSGLLQRSLSESRYDTPQASPASSSAADGAASQQSSPSIDVTPSGRLLPTPNASNRNPPDPASPLLFSSTAPPRDRSPPRFDLQPAFSSQASPSGSGPQPPGSPPQPPHPDHDYGIPSLLSIRVPVPTSFQAVPHHPDLPSLDDVLEFHISTLDHIPRACRDSCAASLAMLYNNIVADPSVFNWRLLLLFPKAVLYTPLRGGRNSTRNLPTVILDRIKRWSQGHFLPLWLEARENQVKLFRRSRRRGNQNPTKDFNARRSEKLARSGQYGRAIQALSSQGLADDSEEVFEALSSKHPQAPPPVLPEGPLPATITISAEVVKQAVQSFHPDTAPGPSGMRANYFKDLLAAPNANQRQRYFQALSSLVNAMNRGKVPYAIRPYLFAATLHAIKKKHGGIRPIAVGDVYSRLTSKCLASSLAEDAASFFSPLQLGVKVRGGCKSVIHATSAVFHSPSPIEERFILQVDLENAYNNISRSLILAEARKHFPALSSWAELSYGSPSNLYFKGRKLQSSVGVKQGDPVAGMLFAAGLQPTIARMNAEAPNLTANMWIMDDGTICGRLEDLRRVVTILEADGPSRGLLLNKAKSSIWVGDLFQDDPDPLGCGIPKADPHGILLLGSPIGSSDFMDQHVGKRISTIEDTIVSRLPSLEDPQIQLCLLRSCLALPKLIYTLRTCKPNALRSAYDRFDAIQHSALEDILGASLTPLAWRQASLPVSLGGIGLRSASSHAAAAFLSSIAQSKPTVDEILRNFPFRHNLDMSLAVFRTAAGSLPPEVLADLSDPSTGDFSQKRLSHLIDSNRQSALLHEVQTDGDVRSSARLLSLTLPLAGAFLNAVPSHVFGLSIIPENFRVSLLYRLGLPVYAASLSCPACGKDSDAFGDHTITCATEHERIFRHDVIRDAIFEEAKHAGLSPIKEARALVSNSQSRPGDIFLQNWRGRQTAFDVAVTSPLSKTALPRSSIAAGAALESMKAAKMNKHSRPCQANGISFVPLVVETLGGWDGDALFHLRLIAKQTSARSASLASTATRHFFQRLSVLLQRANASLIAARAPPPAPPHIVGS